jgi:electron transfer flavoprotein alpha/beta subunit
MDRELPVWTAADLDVDTAKVGASGSRVRWPEVYAPPPREIECTMVEADTPEEAATKLVDKLFEEKVL